MTKVIILSDDTIDDYYERAKGRLAKLRQKPTHLDGDRVYLLRDTIGISVGQTSRGKENAKEVH